MKVFPGLLGIGVELGLGEVVLFLEVVRDFEKRSVTVEFVLLGSAKLAGFFVPVGLVVAEHPVAGVARFAMELGEEVLSIDRILLIQLDTCSLGESGVEVGEVNEVGQFRSCGCFAFPVSDEWDVGSHVFHATFASSDDLVIPAR